MYTLDSTVGDILNDEKAKAVIEKFAPGMADNPMISMASGMKLSQIVGMIPGIDDEKKEAIEKALKAIG